MNPSQLVVYKGLMNDILRIPLNPPYFLSRDFRNEISKNYLTFC